MSSTQHKCAKNPLICIVFIMIAGILTARYVLTFPLSLWLAATATLLFLLLYHHRSAKYLLLFSLLFAFSVRSHLAANLLAANHIINFPVQQIRAVNGEIVRAVYRLDERHQYILNCDSLCLDSNWISASGSLLLRTSQIKFRLSEGDGVIVRGNLQTPSGERNPGQFDYRGYLAGQDIYRLITISNVDSLMVYHRDNGWSYRRNVVAPIKAYFNNAFISHLPETDAALLRALLLGEKQDIDRLLISDFQKAGVVHVLAISGLHVGYLVIFIFTLLSFLHFTPVGRLSGLAFILCIYIVLVDFKPPVIRASVMVLLYLWAQLLERKAATGNIIAGAACVILIAEPRELFNPGFQFSFSAVIAIIYGYKRLDKLLPLARIIKGQKFILNMLWTPLLVSAAAVIGTIPLTVYYYGTVPVIALLANLIVIPLVGSIVLLGFFLLIFHGLSSLLADGVGVLIHLAGWLMSTSTKIFAGLPFASIDVEKPSLFFILILVSGIIIAGGCRYRELGKVIPAYMVVVLIYIIIKAIPPQPHLEAYFLDVGQGDATLLRFPNQTTMLIDAGDASQNWDNGALTVVPFLKQAGAINLNYLVASHPHDDHIGGFSAVLEQVTVDTMVMSEYDFWSQNYKNVISLCQTKNIPVRRVGKGDQLYPDSTCRVYIMHPDSGHASISSGSGAECNNSSLVMKVVYGKQSILFTGDLEHDTEPNLFVFGDLLRSEIIKAGHHGSKTSSSVPFLDMVRPLVAVVPVAKKNKFRHPSPVTLQNLKTQGAQLYLTSTSGAVIFHLETDKIRLIRWRNE